MKEVRLRIRLIGSSTAVSIFAIFRNEVRRCRLFIADVKTQTMPLTSLNHSC